MKNPNYEPPAPTTPKPPLNEGLDLSLLLNEDGFIIGSPVQGGEDE